VTIEGGSLKKLAKPQTDVLSESLPEPVVATLGDQPWNIAITGVGGTGVLTIGALLAAGYGCAY